MLRLYRKFRLIFLTSAILIAAVTDSSAYQDILSEADYAFRTLQYSEALSLYNKAASDDPSLENDREFVIKRGVAAYHAGEYSLANTYLVHAKTLGTDHLDYIDFFTAMASLGAGEEDYALNLFRQITAKHPGSPVANEAGFQAGLILHNAGKYAESNGFMQKLVRANNIDAGKYDARFFTAVNFLRSGSVNDGENELKKIIASSPGNARSLEAADLITGRKGNNTLTEWELTLFAEVYRRHGEKSKADNLLNLYFSKFPNGKYLGRAYFERGALRYSKRMYTRAIEDFEQAFKLHDKPKKIRESRLYIARSKSRKGDTEGANREYARYAREYPADRKSSEALWLIALGFERSGQNIRASDAYKTVAAKTRWADYKNRATFRAGFCLYKADHLTKSMEYFRNIRTKTPGNAIGIQAAFWEAKALEKLDRKEEAEKIYKDLASRTQRHYYVIAARERLGKPFPFINDETGISSSQPSGQLQSALEVGRLFGNPWGDRALKAYRRTSGSGRQSQINTYNAYVETGLYDQAIRVADFLYHRHYQQKPYREVFLALYPKYYKNLTYDIPDAKKVEEALFFSVIRRESLFGHNAVSTAGAGGLMQLMPSTAASLAKSLGIAAFKFSDVFKPKTNMRLGIMNIRELMQRFRRNIPLVLAAYNAGDTATRRWMKRYGYDDMDEFIENIEYSETNTFVKEVLKNYYFYRNLYSDNNIDSQ